MKLDRHMKDVIGFSGGNLLLESSEGMGIVEVDGKASEYPRVRALIRWQ